MSMDLFALILGVVGRLLSFNSMLPPKTSLKNTKEHFYLSEPESRLNQNKADPASGGTETPMVGKTVLPPASTSLR